MPKKRFTRVRREGKADAQRATSLDGGVLAIDAAQHPIN